MKGQVHQNLLNLMNFATRSVRDTGVIPKSFKLSSTTLSGIEDNMLHNDIILALLDDEDDEEEEIGGFDKSDVVDSGPIC